MANPGLDDAERAELHSQHKNAPRAVRRANKTAHQAVDEVKQALGERGCGGTTARQISTGTWRRTHFMPSGMRN